MVILGDHQHVQTNLTGQYVENNLFLDIPRSIQDPKKDGRDAVIIRKNKPKHPLREARYSYTNQSMVKKVCISFCSRCRGQYLFVHTTLSPVKSGSWIVLAGYGTQVMSFWFSTRFFAGYSTMYHTVLLYKRIRPTFFTHTKKKECAGRKQTN